MGRLTLLGSDRAIEPADQLEAIVARTPERESALATLERSDQRGWRLV